MKPILIAVLIIDAGLITFILFQWKFMSRMVRRLVLGCMVCVYSAIGFSISGGEAFHEMSEVKFCLKCHVMEEHGKTLNIDDNEVLSAVHYQNNYVPKATACFSCHSDYGLFGPLKAKLNGLRHMIVYYSGNAPEPKKLKTYTPYDVSNCLHCHAESKRFLKKKAHNKNPEMIGEILTAKKGCLVSGCHDMAHGVGIDRGEDETEATTKDAAVKDTESKSAEAKDANAEKSEEKKGE